MSQSVVITGANRGIGLALCRAYLEQGATVYGVCRTPSPELSESGAKIVSNIDVAAEKGPAQLLETLKGVDIDVLINNAGILRADSFGSIKADNVVAQFITNALAPLMVTQALVPQLTSQAKVAMITSRMGSMQDNTSGAYYGYRMSKAAMNAAGKSLALDLKDRGVAVAIIHPGFVQTDMVGGQGDISADEAAKRIVKRIEQLNSENSGSFWHSNGELLPW